MYLCKVNKAQNYKKKSMKNQFKITFLNKDKSFQRDTIYFESYEEAIQWGLNNLEKFNSEMIQFNF
jgi:hypothetical protein